MGPCTMMFIVDKGQIRKVMDAARSAGAPGGTVFLARGTASKTILAALGIGDSRREVLTSYIGDYDKAKHIFDYVIRTVKAKGVAMLIDEDDSSDEDSDMESKWMLIEVISENGYSEDIMATARKAGAKGGTVINAHGTSTEEDVRFFGAPLVPEKEILMIVISKDKADDVISAIRGMDILKKKGMGIVFSIPIRSFANLGQ